MRLNDTLSLSQILVEFLTRIAHFINFVSKISNIEPSAVGNLENLLTHSVGHHRVFGMLSRGVFWNHCIRVVFGITWNGIDRSDVIKESEGPEVSPICQVNHGVVDTVRSPPFHQLFELL